MKIARILLILIVCILISVMTKAQSHVGSDVTIKTYTIEGIIGNGKPVRYFNAIYIGVDSINGTQHFGTYMYAVRFGQFASRSNVIEWIQKDYKLRCRKIDIAILIQEYKSKSEWLKNVN